MLWNISDGIIYKSQSLSENKLFYIRTVLTSVIMSFMAVIGVAVIYRQTVVKGLEKDSIYDSMTRAFNRRYLFELMEKEISRAERGNRVFSLIMLDIDHFKNVNDTYGHGTGDTVLIEVSKLVLKTIRKYDAFARIGGEEFVCFLPNTEAENALALAERLRVLIEELEIEGKLKVTASFGVTQFKGDEKADTVLNRADEALYEAKNTGRNKCVLKC